MSRPTPTRPAVTLALFLNPTERLFSDRRIVFSEDA